MNGCLEGERDQQQLYRECTILNALKLKERCPQLAAHVNSVAYLAAQEAKRNSGKRLQNNYCNCAAPVSDC